MKELTQKKVFLLLVIIAAFLASRHLFRPGYFIMHDDLQMMRQLEMEKCFRDRQLPCRWVPDMGLGYGYPLFNFYPPLPYYLGQIFRWLKFSFVDTAKLTFALQFFLSGITMFVLAADLWGDWGGLLSAVFYIWAPYHAVDVYVRGAMNEAWAFVWFPLIFWAGKKLIEEEKLRYLFWLAFSWAMLLLTHGIMAMVFSPALLIWVFYWLLKYKKVFKGFSLWIKLVLSALWSAGLAAFFVFPMLWEKKFVHIETMFSGYYDWRAHFVSLRQLFLSTFWGYGPSTWGDNDGMPFPIGHIHWLLAGLIIFWWLIKIIGRLKKKKSFPFDFFLPGGIFLLGLFYAFLTHARSVYIWQLVKPLQLAQFPWRLLAGAAFFFSLLAGFLNTLTKKKGLILGLAVLVVVFNWRYFRPKSMGPLTDREKFSGKAWRIQQTASIYDYLPKTVPRAPSSPPSQSWTFAGQIKGEGKFQKGTNWALWEGEVVKPGTLLLSIFDFPGWRGWINEREVKLKHDKKLGRIMVAVPRGKVRIYLRFTNTPVRAWADLASLLSWWVLLGVVLGPKIWRLIPKN